MPQIEPQLAHQVSTRRPCSGADLAQLLNDLTHWFGGYVDHLNALNVFPVPDGDTGTNMARTLQSAAEAIPDPPGDAADVLQAATRGALMGASGNSGVILSQMIRGFSAVYREAPIPDASVLQAALAEGARAGYASVAQPVEGTILTVARRAAESALDATSPAEVFRTAHEGARVAVSETPDQLERLRSAGVVDAGGEGLRLILDGVHRWLAHLPLEPAPAAPVATRALVGIQHTDGDTGYCTQFVIEGSAFEPDELRNRLQILGRSLVVVAADDLVRVHIHADRPGAIIDEVASIGRLRNISIDDMDAQHEQARTTSSEGASDVGIVTVAQSAEAAALLAELGAARVIPLAAGESPSVQQIVSAIQAVGYEHVLFLPNDRNAVLAAEQARRLVPRSIQIVPTGNLAEAITCLVAFNFSADLDHNVARMREELRRVTTLELARATRAATYPDATVAMGDIVVLDQGSVAAAGGTVSEALERVLIGLNAPELATLYSGADATPSDLELMETTLRRTWPDAEINLVDARQPYRLGVLALE